MLPELLSAAYVYLALASYMVWLIVLLPPGRYHTPFSTLSIITLGLYFAFLARSFSLIYSFSVLLNRLSACFSAPHSRP